MILSGTGTYQYISYSTGNFDVDKGKKSPGLNLQFVNVDTGESANINFNVSLSRTRSRGKCKAGSELPSGQFSVRLGHSFVKFWLMAGLELPKSLTRFHKCMGKLKDVRFQFDVDSNERINKDTMNELNLHLKGISRALLGHKEGISRTLEQDIRISTNVNSLEASSHSQVRELNSADKGYKGKGIKGESLTPFNTSNNHINKTADCANESTRLMDVETARIQSQSPDEWLADYNQ